MNIVKTAAAILLAALFVQAGTVLVSAANEAAKPAAVAAPASASVQDEIERKFVIDPEKLPADMKGRSKIYEIVQTYINYSPEIRVRKINDKTYYFNVKRPKDDTGLAREEIQFRITAEDYETLRKKRVGSTIYKTRYQFYEGDTYVFVDVYTSRKLEGLVVAEVEFESAEAAAAFTPPQWFGKDVTEDSRYKNQNLARYGMPGEEKGESSAKPVK